MRAKQTTVAMVAMAIAIAAGPARGATLWERLFGSKKSSAILDPTGGRLPVRIPPYLDQAIREAAAETRLDPNLLAAVAWQESRFDPRAVSSRGAQGIMQLMPRTAAYLGVTDPFDVRQNVRGGARYLAEMFATFGGDLELSLAAYNAGPWAVKAKGVGATAEAQHYVRAVRSFYRPSRPRPWLG